MAILLIDDECGVCNGFVRFVFARERTTSFQFASLHSALAHELLSQHRLLPDGRSIVLITTEGKAMTRSTAVLACMASLTAPWCWLARLRVIPTALRDWVYDIVATHRLAFVASTNSRACAVPESALHDRWLS